MPQIETSFGFIYIWDFVLFLVLLKLFGNKLGFQGLQKMQDQWASPLMETGAGQYTGSGMPTTLEMPYRKWEG